jgi:DNA-binding XRE family transcriptional regulator
MIGERVPRSRPQAGAIEDVVTALNLDPQHQCFNGAAFRQARINAGYGLTDLSVACGKSPFTWRSYELGRFRPSIDVAYRAAQILGVPFESFFSPTPEVSMT